MTKQIRTRLAAWVMAEVGGILAVLVFWAFLPNVALLSGLMGVTAGVTLVTAGFILWGMFHPSAPRTHVPDHGHGESWERDRFANLHAALSAGDRRNVDIHLSGVSSPETEPASIYTRPPLPRPANRVEEEIRRRLASGDAS